MENWQTMFLGLKQLPRELSAFEIEAFFTFSEAERATIETRRRPELQLGLALQIGFLPIAFGTILAYSSFAAKQLGVRKKYQ